MGEYKMRGELKRLLDQAVESGLALARDPAWPKQRHEQDAVYTPRRGNYPAITRVAASLRSGFATEEEARARDNDEFQRTAQIFWRVELPSFWMLARFLAEGDDFPFRKAMSQHLNDIVGRQSQLALDSGFTRQLAEVLKRLGEARDAWNRLRERVLSWEANSRRFLAEFPPPVGAFASRETEPFEHSEELEGGLTIHLEEVVTSKLHVAVSRPADDSGPETVHITLMGETGEHKPAELHLLCSGEFSGGRVDIGDFGDILQNLGTRCLVVISPFPLPNLPE